MQTHAEQTNYTVNMVMKDGTVQESGEWTSLPVAKRIANNVHNHLLSVLDSGVDHIEVIDVDSVVHHTIKE